eukprot:CAMPEP_0114043048 /NCGR_PEP_ID=MMETSP1339-20121228/6218_1 /TAXON_ID=94617 /ORGANISM="Fibrocapsa japonica" /LENGTH=49 /assembly_acc=CAM_ASM_000762
MGRLQNVGAEAAIRQEETCIEGSQCSLHYEGGSLSTPTAVGDLLESGFL